MKQYDVIVVGGGASGMTAAIQAAKEGSSVLLLEGADKVGKKILVTGNGKCNLTNEYQEASCYRGDCPEKIQAVLADFTYKDTHDFFRSLGILTRNKNGYIYPYNEQAAAVREAFALRISGDSKISLMCDSYVTDVEPTRKGYLVRTKDRKYSGRTVILTTGGYAGPKIGCDGSGYRMAGRMGHEIVRPLPALTPLKSSAPFLKKASGVRNQALIHLLIDGEESVHEQGELQWTDYGISGVAIFQLSRYAIVAMEEGRKVSLSLDFLPEYAEETFKELLWQLICQCSYKNMAELLYGLLPLKLIPILLREARIEESLEAGMMSTEQVDVLCRTMKHFVLRINGYVGYDKAQVTRGGVSMEEVTGQLESVYHKGLFFAGEVLDVDGTCGGYNLQWAFSSGSVAGRAAASCSQRGKEIHA